MTLEVALEVGVDVDELVKVELTLVDGDVDVGDVVIELVALDVCVEVAVDVGVKVAVVV